jgi:hypothetical protein
MKLKIIAIDEPNVSRSIEGAIYIRIYLVDENNNKYRLDVAEKTSSWILAPYLNVGRYIDGCDVFKDDIIDGKSKFVILNVEGDRLHERLYNVVASDEIVEFAKICMKYSTINNGYNMTAEGYAKLLEMELVDNMKLSSEERVFRHYKIIVNDMDAEFTEAGNNQQVTADIKLRYQSRYPELFKSYSILKKVREYEFK